MPIDAAGLFPATAAMPVGALSGYWGQQRQDAGLDAASADLTAQNTSNAQQSNILQNALADNPNLAAQRVLTGSDIATKQQGFDSGQQSQVQSANLNAATQTAITKMDTDQLSDTLVHHQAYVAMDNFISQPGFDITNPASQTALKAMASAAKMGNVPDTFTTADVANIHALGQAAINTIPFIQQNIQTSQKQGFEAGQNALDRTNKIVVAQEQGQNSILRTLLSMPTAQQTFAQAQIAIQNQGGQVTTEQKDAIKGQIENTIRTSPIMQDIEKSAASLQASENGQSDSKTEADAQKVGIDTKDVTNKAQQALQISNIWKEQQVQKMVDQQYNAKFGSIPVVTKLTNAPNPAASNIGGAVLQPPTGTAGTSVPSIPPGALTPTSPSVPAATNGPVQIKNAADYAALKPGTPFIDPNGRPGIKGSGG